MLLTKKSFTYKPWLDTGFLTIENTTEKEKYTGNDWNKKLYCKCKVETHVPSSYSCNIPFWDGIRVTS